MNIGTGREISIRKLAETIARLTDFTGNIIWQREKPYRQPRRLLDVSRAFERFGFRAETSLEEGLRRTIDWYRAQD